MNGDTKVMTRRSIGTLAFSFAAGICLMVALGAGETPSSPGTPPSPAAIENYMKSTKPNEKHKHLEQFVGEFETVMRVFWAPGAPPMESKGTASHKMVHGGRFLQEETKGAMKMPDADGNLQDMPIAGMGLVGYDNNKKLYTMAWTDTMNTGILTAKGSLSRDGKVMTFFGEMDEPLTGEMGKSVRYLTRIISADKYVFEISEVLYGEPFKVVEIEYTRKK